MEVGGPIILTMTLTIRGQVQPSCMHMQLSVLQANLSQGSVLTLDCHFLMSGTGLSRHCFVSSLASCSTGHSSKITRKIFRGHMHGRRDLSCRQTHHCTSYISWQINPFVFLFTNYYLALWEPLHGPSLQREASKLWIVSELEAECNANTFRVYHRL